jgi:hypothetical protein
MGFDGSMTAESAMILQRLEQSNEPCDVPADEPATLCH